MGDKVGENPAALRAAVFLLSAKNRSGGVQTPPSMAKVKCVCNATTNGGDALFDESLTNDSIGIIVNVPKYNKFFSTLPLLNFIPFQHIGTITSMMPQMFSLLLLDG